MVYPISARKGDTQINRGRSRCRVRPCYTSPLRAPPGVYLNEAGGIANNHKLEVDAMQVDGRPPSNSNPWGYDR